ncbi:Organic cation transporter protein [Papilio machaon]|uniref:Organic cation transporter protein n=1 Tax=Papilio machaon TaxID=76193 RepID=A0A194REW9_PAPMA|nr:Organic cation transporter protein [Papilio machaon]
MANAASETIDLDSILKQLGAFGKYNIVNYALLLFPIFLAGMYGSVFVFEGPDISYRCEISQCEGSNESFWIEHAIPRDKNELSKCKQYQFIGNYSQSNRTCSEPDFNKAVIEECEKYVYSDEDSAVKDVKERGEGRITFYFILDSPTAEYTRVARALRVMVRARGVVIAYLEECGLFNLGCQNWKRTLIGTIHNSGLFLSLPLTGIISDRYGRKVALSIACLMNGIFGFIRSFSTSYIMMLIFEFLEAGLGAGAYSTAFVLAMELVGPKGRVFGNTLINAVYVLGLMSLSGLSWWLQDWRLQIRIIYAPAFLGFTYLWILNESVRWLLSKGRQNEAVDILKKAMKMNKVDLSDDVLSPLSELGNAEDTKSKEVTPKEEENKSSFSRALKSNIIRKRVLVCSFLWITCTFVYYGLSINSVSLAGNKYLNFMLVAFVEIPANFACLLVLDRFGRKRTLITTYVLSACLCISLSLIPKDQKWLPLIIYLSGKFSITIAYSSVYIYVSEVFPTNVRQSLLAVCSALGRVGSTLAPLTPLLALYYDNLPAIFFGSMTLVASALVFTLPETINVPLPDTVEEAEKLSRRKDVKDNA